MSLFRIPLNTDFFETLACGLEQRFDPLAKIVVLLPTKPAVERLKRCYRNPNSIITTIDSYYDDKLDATILSDFTYKLELAVFLQHFMKIEYLEAFELAPKIIDIIKILERDGIIADSECTFTAYEAPLHIQKLFDLFKSMSAAWYGFLKSQNLSSLEQKRIRGSKRAINNFKRNKPDYPIVVAGSTGSIKSTRSLMRAIHTLDQGCVVLKCDTSDFSNPDIATKHPYYFYKILANELGEGRLTEWTSGAEVFDPTVTVQEFRSINDETLHITLKAKELLSYGYKSIVIISNNNAHTSRLAMLLKKFCGIDACIPRHLCDSPQVQILFHVLDLIESNFAPMQLLKFLKYSSDMDAKTLHEVEVKYLRGVRKYDGLDELIQISKAEFLLELKSRFGALIQLLETPKFDFKIIFNELLKFIPSIDPQLLSAFSSLINASLYLNDISELKNIIFQVCSTCALENGSSDDSKVRILRTQDARFSTFDYLIISDLNEGSWPKFTQTLSGYINPSNIGTNIGKAAYDFACFINHREVLLTRSVKNTKESRWIVQMENKLNASLMPDVYKPSAFIRILPPNPIPAPELRPKELSVTKVERLVNDPYSVYVSDILRLKELEWIDKRPSHLEFGIYIHHMIEITTKQNLNKERAVAIGKAVLEQDLRDEFVQKLFLSRWEKIASWIIDLNNETTAKVMTETKGFFELQRQDMRFSITAKADRIESKEGLCTIIDFKTGNPPTLSDIRSAKAPQLLLEKLILENGGFASLQALEANKLCYIQVPKLQSNSKTLTLDGSSEFITLTTQSIIDVIFSYFDCNKSYANPDNKSPYHPNLFRNMEFM